jgi:hypothetical protein
MSTTAVLRASDRPMLAVGVDAGAWPPLDSRECAPAAAASSPGGVARLGVPVGELVHPVIRVARTQRPCT